jgi:hypothetical protein
LIHSLLNRGIRSIFKCHRCHLLKRKLLLTLESAHLPKRLPREHTQLSLSTL